MKAGFIRTIFTFIPDWGIPHINLNLPDNFVFFLASHLCVLSGNTYNAELNWNLPG